MTTKEPTLEQIRQSAQSHLQKAREGIDDLIGRSATFRNREDYQRDRGATFVAWRNLDILLEQAYDTAKAREAAQREEKEVKREND